MQVEEKKDVIVVGAGLAGLISALTLQKSGYSVVLIDRRAQVGGLCGTFEIEGHEFVIACNDFGSGLVKLLSELGVEQQFEYKKSSIYYKGTFFNATPNLKMLSQLRSEWKNVVSLIGGILAQQLPSRPVLSIEEFADRYTSPGVVNDLTKIIAYFMGVAPYDINTSYLGLDGKFGYGYTKMACPKGGPQTLSNAITQAFIKQGGKLLLNTSYRGHSKRVNRFYIALSSQNEQMTMQSDYLVDTTEYVQGYSPETKRGLPLSMMCLAVNNKFIYPENTHTLSYYQPGVSQWFRMLDMGKKPAEFGFHVFKSDLNSSNTNTYTLNENTYTLNVYFYLPRNTNQLDENQRDFYRQYLLEKIELMLPGITEHIFYSRIITPEDFKIIHGLSSRVMPFISFGRKPNNNIDDSGYFKAGHTVFPPGEHAGAAALSGYLVAKSIMNS
jgi:phytoene dehydrogenase-like protein